MKWMTILSVSVLVLAKPCWAESQGTDYKGITDPFGDPANYEFADDEREDKDFFHLGRFLMLGIDGGVGLYTGGLGKTVNPGFYIGAHLLFFFDRSLALEGAAHYVDQQDNLNLNNGTDILIVDENLIPLTLGMRYYFDVRNAPKAIAVANPYLAAGAGVYIRLENVLKQTGHFATVTSTAGGNNANSTSFGGHGGGGIQFDIYHRHIFLGLDMRYHVIFFPDTNDDLNVQGVDNSGNFVTATVGLTYNF
jgi:hypothetical protein